MKTKQISAIRNVEADARLLFWFAMVLMVLMFVWSLFIKPALLQPGLLALYLGLFAVHIFLHWQVEKVAVHKKWLVGYTLLQGGLAFVITYLSGTIGMVFCLFMALIGELLAIYRVSIGGILACAYLLGLAFTNFVLLMGINQAWWFGIGTIPTIIFIGIYVILFTRQAEANTRAGELLVELEAANHQLREYAAKVEDLTIAAERQRMARDLHDTLSQGLAGLILQLEAVDAHLAGKRPDRARAILQQTMERARAILTDARRAIDDLRRSSPPDLKEAVLQEVERFTASTGLPCPVEIDLPADLPQPVAETALRAISESLANIARHAQAHAAKLSLAVREGVLSIEICDDGIGFDPEAVQAGHYGLLGMRERIRLAGGSIEVRSGAGQGTQLTIQFPLAEGEHA